MADEQTALEQIVRTWNINPEPEYRSFRCAVCQQQTNEAFYHWLNSAHYCLPVHFCAACQHSLENGTLAIPDKSGHEPLAKDYGETVNQAFCTIVDRWHPKASDTAVAYYCDSCSMPLDIDPRDNQRKGYHVWWQRNGRWYELHFHQTCGDGILHDISVTAP